MAVAQTLKEIALEKAKKRPELVDYLTEEAPILTLLKWIPATHGLWNVEEVLDEITGASFTDLGAPLPTMQAETQLRQTYVSLMGGEIEVSKDKAAQFGVVLPDEVVTFIGETVTSNIRQLEGVVKKLTAYRDLLEDDITVSSVRRAIKDVIRVGTYVPTPNVIIAETARYFSVSEEALRGQSRQKNTATARQVAMYLCRNLTNMALTDIGAQFEGRNHATVLASIRKIEDMMQASQEFAMVIRDVTYNINSKA